MKRNIFGRCKLSATLKTRPGRGPLTESINTNPRPIYRVVGPWQDFISGGLISGCRTISPLYGILWMKGPRVGAMFGCAQKEVGPTWGKLHWNVPALQVRTFGTAFSYSSKVHGFGHRNKVLSMDVWNRRVIRQFATTLKWMFGSSNECINESKFIQGRSITDNIIIFI